jgi:IclR family transcriptional regulator, pca regulon regulatory protein
MANTRSSPQGTRSGEFVQALERGLAVIRAFSEEHPALTLSDVGRLTGLTRATARRFLLTLEQLGYVKSDGRLFALRPKVLDLGHPYLASLTLPKIAEPHMESLVAEVHESSSASVLDGHDIVYVLRIPTKRIMTISLAVGTRLPAYATSMGRVLLASLPAEDLDRYFDTAKLVALTQRTVVDITELRVILDQVTAQGWCLVDQELEEGVRSIAAPLVSANGQVQAALNVSAHAARVPLDTLRTEFLPKLLKTAGEINADLAARR